MTILDPLSAGLRMMFGFLFNSIRALRSGPDRLSGMSVGARKCCRALLFRLMNCLVMGWS